MPTRSPWVTSDTWVGSGQPNTPHGEDEQLRVRSGQQVALLWAKIPWDRDTEVNVQSHALRLVCDGGCVGAADLVVRALAQRFTDTEVTWNDLPATTGPTGSYSIPVGGLADGEVVLIPAAAIGQDIAAGARNTGVMLTTTSGTTIRFHSADSPDRPRWVSTWTEEPAPPTIRPAGGIISAQFPVFGYGYDDAEGDLSAVRIQLDPTADPVSPDFDSGPVTTSEALLRTADTTTPAYPGLAAAAVVSARGSITLGGVESDFGDWVTLQRIPKGTIVIDSPGVAGVVTSVTPTILGTFTPADGVEALTEQRVQIWDAARETRLYNGRRVPSADPNTIAADIPFRDPVSNERILRKKGVETYSVRVQGWGYPDRVDAPQDSADVEVWADFTVDHNAVLTAPAGVTVGTVDGRPSLTIGLTIAPDAPDKIVIGLDDDIVEVLDPATVHVGGTSYDVEYAGVKPYTDVAVKVAKIVDGDMSPWSTTVVAQSRPEGVWVVDEARGLRFHLFGLDIDGWRFTDQGIFYDPVGSPHQVRVITSQQGMSGSFTGDLRDAAGLTHDAQLADLWAIKERPSRTVRLVCERWSIPVRLDDLSASPHSDSFPDQPASLVSFGFRQHGERPFRSRL